MHFKLFNLLFICFASATTFKFNHKSTLTTSDQIFDDISAINELQRIQRYVIYVHPSAFKYLAYVLFASKYNPSFRTKQEIVEGINSVRFFNFFLNKTLRSL